MVGSVLMQRMVEEKDFDLIEPVYYSTSQIGIPCPCFRWQRGGSASRCLILMLAWKQLDAVITRQGGDYTSKSLPSTASAGWCCFH
ncbi:hypothetical protein O9993_13860 [Vibrio lentus]|nr:hypothetical protein [Vibrio lentus]